MSRGLEFLVAFRPEGVWEYEEVDEEASLVLFERPLDAEGVESTRLDLDLEGEKAASSAPWRREDDPC